MQPTEFKNTKENTILELESLIRQFDEHIRSYDQRAKVHSNGRPANSQIEELNALKKHRYHLKEEMTCLLANTSETAYELKEEGLEKIRAAKEFLNNI